MSNSITLADVRMVIADCADREHLFVELYANEIMFAELLQEDEFIFRFHPYARGESWHISLDDLQAMVERARNELHRETP
jgi:hypothetical protein